MHLKTIVKSKKQANIPDVLVSFLESIDLIPKRKLLNIFFLLFYAIFFQKKDKQNLTSVLSFLVFSNEETQKSEHTGLGAGHIAPFQKIGAGANWSVITIFNRFQNGGSC